MDLGALTAAMTDALVAHVHGARRSDDGGTVDLGFGGLRASCEVTQMHSPTIAELHVWLTGGALAPAWIEDTWAGFGDSPEHAVVQGVHDWVQGSFHAVRAAFGGGDGVTRHPREMNGVARVVYASPLSLRGDPGRFDALTASAKPDLAERIIAADVLPWLPPERPHVLGTFVARVASAPPTLEVKLNGVGWPAAHAPLASLPWPPGVGYLSVRELAVLGAGEAGSAPALPDAALLRRTLAGLAQSEHAPRVHGVRAHGFALEPPLDAGAVDALERDAGVTLPADYRAFVTSAGRAGAGPGYGLLPPDNAAQRELARARFPAGAEDITCDAEPAGVLALAHHGCGYVSVLVVDGGPHHGEVWNDLRTADSGLVRASGSFTEWYRAWLAALVSAYAPAVVGDVRRCALPRALSSFLTAEEQRLKLAPGTLDAASALRTLARGSVATAATGDAYFAAGAPLDLCAGCRDLARRVGLRDEQIAPGTPPRQAG